MFLASESISSRSFTLSLGMITVLIPCWLTFTDSDEIKQAVDYIVGVRQDEPAGAAPSSIIKLGAHGEVKVIRE